MERSPLIECASGLLCIAAELRGTASPPSLSALHARLVEMVSTLERCARAEGLAERVVLPARYFLCVLLDESVLETPWGAESAWHEHRLLSLFHQENDGGAKCFDAIERLLKDPATHRELLALAYLCLAMGLKGPFHGEGAAEALQRVRTRLYRSLCDPPAGSDSPLLVHRGSATVSSRGAGRRVPRWLLPALLGVVLTGAIVALSGDQYRQATRMLDGLDRLGVSDIYGESGMTHMPMPAGAAAAGPERP